MGKVDITDEKSAQAWLEKQPHQVRIWFASRCALRAVPALQAVPDETFDHLVFKSFRAILISGAAGTCPAPEISAYLKAADSAARSALSAAHSADSAAHSADSAAHSALSAARSAHSAHSAAHSALSAALSAHSALSAARSAHSAALSAHSALSAARSAHSAALSAASEDTAWPGEWPALWPGNRIPEGLAGLWPKMEQRLSAAPEKWAFWLEWYRAILIGEPLNWALTQQIAKDVTDEQWDAGPEVVAERIEEIKANYLIETAPLAEQVELNQESGRFRVIPLPLENPALLSAMIARTDDAIEDALLGQNGLRQDSHEVRKLRRTHARYANDPQRLEMDYTSVAISLRRQISDTGELAESEDNLALLEAVEEGALAIRAHHPEVAENRKRIAAQKLRELGPAGIELLEDAQPLLEALSEGAMQEDFRNDIPALINDATTPLPSGAPPLPGADQATRIFNRAGKMKQLYEKSCETGAKVFDSKEFKTVRLGWTVTRILSALVRLGLRLFGVL